MIGIMVQIINSKDLCLKLRTQTSGSCKVSNTFQFFFKFLVCWVVFATFTCDFVVIAFLGLSNILSPFSFLGLIAFPGPCSLLSCWLQFLLVCPKDYCRYMYFHPSGLTRTTPQAQNLVLMIIFFRIWELAIRESRIHYT